MRRGFTYGLRRTLCLVAFLAFGIAMTAFADMTLLWWQVGDPTEWSGDDLPSPNSLDSLMVTTGDGTASASSLGINAARVRVVGGDYLTAFSYDPDEDPAVTTYDPPNDWMYVPTVSYVDVSGFTDGSPEYSFMIELGNWNNGQWTAIADSEAASYGDIAQNMSQWSGSFEPSPASAWAPTQFTVVPEPSSGVMLALGAALLSLRRRRRLRG